MRVELDMDGVIADFASAAIQRLNERYGRRELPEIRWKFYEHWGINHDQFVNCFDNREWWRTIPQYPHTQELIWTVRQFDPDFGICTSPMPLGNCRAGKLDWLLERRLGGRHKLTFAEGCKSLHATPETVLIDDRADHCEAFEKAGGWAICWKQPWSGEFHRQANIKSLHLELSKIRTEIDARQTRVQSDLEYLAAAILDPGFQNASRAIEISKRILGEV